MSDDIVMRLRASSLAWRISLMPEAADEIERLRSALDTAIRERNEAWAEVKRLRAENARLRAQIVEYFREPGTHEVERLTRQRDEARAEVERLTGKLKLVADALNETISKYHEVGDQNDRLDAENERLREALALGSEVLASHQGTLKREWHNVGAWLYAGDTINVVRAPLPEIAAPESAEGDR